MQNSRVKRFPISGIERNTDPLNATGGAMEDCLNLVFRNKSVLSVQAAPQAMLPQCAGRAYSYIHSLPSGERILISVDRVDAQDEHAPKSDDFVPGKSVTGHYKIVASHRATSDGVFKPFRECALCEVQLQNGQIAFSSNGNLLLIDFINEALIPTAKPPTVTQGNNQNSLRVMLRDTTLQDVSTQSGWLDLGGEKKKLDTPEKLPGVWIEKRKDATGNAVYYYCGQDKRSGFVYSKEIADSATLEEVKKLQTESDTAQFEALSKDVAEKLQAFAELAALNTANIRNARQVLYLWYEDSYTEQFVPDNAPLIAYTLEPGNGVAVEITNIEDVKRVKEAQEKAEEERKQIEAFRKAWEKTPAHSVMSWEKFLSGSHIDGKVHLAGKLGFPKGDFTDYLGLCKDYLLTQTDYLYERILLFAVVKLFDGTYLHPSRIYDIGAVQYACMRMGQDDSKGRKEKGEDTLFYPISCNGHFYTLEKLCASLVIPPHLNEAKHLQLIDSLELYAFRFDPYMQPDKNPYATEEAGVNELSALFADRGILSEATDFRLVASAAYRDNEFKIKLTSKDKKTLFNSGNFAALSPLFYPLDRFAQEPAFDWSRIVPVKHMLAKRHTYNRRNFLYQMKECPTLAECLPAFNPLFNSPEDGANGMFFSVRTTDGEELYPAGCRTFVEQGAFLGMYGLPYFYTAIPWIDEVSLYDTRSGGNSFELKGNELKGLCDVSRIKLYRHPILPISFAEENNPKYPLTCVETKNKLDLRYKIIPYHPAVHLPPFYHYGTPLEVPVPKNRDFFKWEEYRVVSNRYFGAFSAYRDKPNSVKVLTTDNPIGGIASDTFSFPAPVRALSVLQMTPEEYHFGSYPTLVFTGSGIYALRQNDSGEHYIAVVPLLPDVVTSRNVAVTPRGVAYVSEGHLKLYANSATCVSEPIAYDLLPTPARPDKTYIEMKYEQYFPAFPTSYPFDRRSRHVTDLLNGEADLYYDDRDHVLILPFPQEGMSLCLNLDFMQWTRRTSQHVRFLGSHNRIYPITADGALLDWGRVGASGAVTPIFLQSKPFTLGDPVRIEELRINGTSYPAPRVITYTEENETSVVTYNDKVLGSSARVLLLLYGSNDATHFTLLGARHFPQPERHLILPLNRTHAFRYYSFTLMGYLPEGSSDFLSFDLTYSPAFTNRLR